VGEITPQHDDTVRRPAGAIPKREAAFQRMAENTAQRQERAQCQEHETDDHQTLASALETRGQQHDADKREQD